MLEINQGKYASIYRQLDKTTANTLIAHTTHIVNQIHKRHAIQTHRDITILIIAEFLPLPSQACAYPSAQLDDLEARESRASLHSHY